MVVQIVLQDCSMLVDFETAGRQPCKTDAEDSGCGVPVLTICSWTVLNAYTRWNLFLVLVVHAKVVINFRAWRLDLL